MFDSKKRKEARMKFDDQISASRYNGIIGGTLLYGFLLNALLVLVAGEFVSNTNPMVFFIAYFIMVIVGSFLANWSTNPIVSFIGYNLIAVPIGALLSIALPFYASELILTAILVTAAVTAIMMILSMQFPHVFEKLGMALFISLLVGLVAEIIASLLGYGGDLFNWLFVLIFSLYIGYDWHKAQTYPKTIDNAIDSAIDLYLDIINLFVRLLSILSKHRD